MNSRKRVDESTPTSVRDRLAHWRQLLERCGRKATRKRVHALRVVTLRVQAELERDLADLPRASHQAQAILRFGKRAEKLRQALAPVRELDVWIGKLRGLRGSLNKTDEYVPRSMRECVGGIDRLEERLKKKRIVAEKRLVAAINKPGRLGGRLVKASEDVEQSLSDHIFGADAGTAEELAARFRAVRAEFSNFDEENLHEFRKRIKAVRYLAEIHAGANRATAQIASQMKKVQSAIGEWHDWQELGREAHRGHRAKSKPLAELLDTVTAESFETALSTVHAVSAQMQGDDPVQDQDSHPEHRKLPARGDYGPFADLDKKLA